MRKITTVKMVVAFSLALLLGASLFVTTEVMSDNNQLVNNRFVNFLLGHSLFQAGKPP
jgi:hypothetical protein